LGVAWSAQVRADDAVPSGDPALDPGDDLSDLTLEELLDVRVTTASNAPEPLAEAPATVILNTHREIERRGYKQLGDVLDDLPGLDVVRPYGDSWVLSYWRGFRTDQTSPFLLMVDGLVVNSLYTSDVEGHIAALPLSNVERIEVVYGPASSVWGAHAFMGVINVITRSDAAEDGTWQDARLGVGSAEERLGDVSLFMKRGKLRLSLAMRVETGQLDDSTHDAYEFTKESYSEDRSLWGGFVDNPNLGGHFRSRHEAAAVDARLFYDRSELAVRYLRFASGYGVQYAADRVQNDAVWARRELSVYGRHAVRLTSWLDTRTLVRYRENGIPNDTYYVDGYDDPTAGRVAAFSYWQARNSSWSILEDTTITPLPWLQLTVGLGYEQKDLQKAYEITGEGAPGTPGGYLPVDQIHADRYDFPEPPAARDRPQNRITVEDLGVYAQGRFEIAHGQLAFAGLRVDRNSGYDPAPTVRVGYVGSFGRLGVKALYGQAYEEPSARALYGGWTGAGSDPDLRPERSQTIEASVSHVWPWITQSLDAYAVFNRNTISTSMEAGNLGRRRVVGFDYALRVDLALPHVSRFELWGYYSRLLLVDEDGERIGDLADDKVHLGVTADVDAHLSASLRGRYIGARPTVATNPVGEVGDYATVDANIEYRDVAGSGLGLGLAVQNLTDERYVQPGVNDASAGVTPGRSAGYFSSLLPQPGLTVMLTMILER
jgi:outer membrane receptor protein involved in Fe transport